jgi:hypothetical protein
VACNAHAFSTLASTKKLLRRYHPDHRYARVCRRVVLLSRRELEFVISPPESLKENQTLQPTHCFGSTTTKSLSIMGITLVQANDRPGLIVMASFFCVISFGVVALRIYSRKLQSLYLKADDWFAVAGMVGSLSTLQSHG